MDEQEPFQVAVAENGEPILDRSSLEYESRSG